MRLPTFVFTTIDYCRNSPRLLESSAASCCKRIILVGLPRYLHPLVEGFPRVNFGGNLPLFVPETLGGGVGIVYVSLRKDSSQQQLPYINRLKDTDREYSRAGQIALERTWVQFPALTWWLTTIC